MDSLQALIIGIVQGLTEFLPVSSTAHVRIVPSLLGWEDPGAAVTAVTQLGTLAAVFIYFWNDWTGLLKAGVISVTGFSGRHSWTPDFTHQVRLAWFIVLGTVPIGVCGLLFKDYIENEWRSLYIIGGALIALAVLLAVAETAARHLRTIRDMTFRDTQWVGLAQALALIPGVSRSGVTLTAGLFIGLTRESAARYSFLLSIPAITASGLLELKDLIENGFGGIGLFNLVLATLAAGVVGYASIAFLIRWLQTRSTLIFIVYRIVIGAVIIGLAYAGIIR